METFIELKELTDNPQYQAQKRRALSSLADDMIDLPIRGIANGFNKLPYCFTLQSCYGHFVYDGQEDPHNLDPLPEKDNIVRVECRIGYIVFCVDNSPAGKELLKSLRQIMAIDPENIQFCCAQWFWERQVNSYVLQVEPDRFKRKDTATVDLKEALHIEKVRNEFFVRLNELL